jgi:hypothetical protein
MENMMLLNPIDPKDAIMFLLGRKSKESIQLIDIDIFENEPTLRDSEIQNTTTQCGSLLYDYQKHKYTYKPVFITKAELCCTPVRFVTYFYF